MHFDSLFVSWNDIEGYISPYNAIKNFSLFNYTNILLSVLVFSNKTVAIMLLNIFDIILITDQIRFKIADCCEERRSL